DGVERGCDAHALSHAQRVSAPALPRERSDRRALSRGDRAVLLGDIRAPIFAVATEADHVAPWRSVYKLSRLTDPDLTFVLTSGGHNAGIVSEPGHPRRHYRIARRPPGRPYVEPDLWMAMTEPREGSWWQDWAAWLEALSSGKAAPPGVGATEKGYPPLCPAPGTYVLER